MSLSASLSARGGNLTIYRFDWCTLVAIVSISDSGVRAKGEITLDGTPLSQINLRSLHRHTGLVAQDTQLFGSTVEDNIAYGLEPDECVSKQLSSLSCLLRANF